MPQLNTEILLDILDQIVKDNSGQSKNLQLELFKFAIAGRECLKLFLEYLRKAKECTVDDNCYIVNIRNAALTIGPSPDNFQLMMRKIGSSIKTLNIQCEPQATRPIIDAVCEAQQLVTLDLEDPSGVPTFQRVIKECAKSLKNIIICVNTDIPSLRNDQYELSLDELVLEVDLACDFHTFFKQNCCRTKSIIFELHQFLPTSSFQWQYILDSFTGINNPVLHSVKHLKIRFEIEEDSTALPLQTFINNIASTFPCLETLEIEKEVPTEISSDHNEFYEDLRNQLSTVGHRFKTKILWTASRRCCSLRFQIVKHKAKISPFNVVKEDDAQIILERFEVLNSLLELTFKVRIFPKLLDNMDWVNLNDFLIFRNNI